MNARNKFLILLSIIVAISAVYYFFSTPRGNDLVLVGTVDANQIVVSPQIQGRILKLLVDEGTPVKQGDLIAVLDPSELEAEERAATATIASLRSQVSANRIHAEVDERIDRERCSQCAGAIAGFASATGPGRGNADAHGKRQPSNNWAGRRRRGIGPGKGPGRNEPESAAGERRFTKRAGRSRASHFEFSSSSYEPGNGSGEHGGIDARADGERDRAT